MYNNRDPYIDDSVDFNDYTLPQYIHAHILWGLIFAFAYKHLLFRRIPGYNGFCSALILAGIVIVACMIGIFFQYKDDRHFLWIMVNLFIGFGIYTVVSYISIYTAIVLAALVIPGALLVLNALFICIKKIKKRKKLRRIISSIMGSFVGGWSIYGHALAALMVCLVLSSAFSRIGINAVAEDLFNGSGENLTIENSMDVLVNLDAQKWETLDQREKLNVLQRIVDIERNYMGIDHNILVYVKELDEDTNVGAYYSEYSHSIGINMRALTNSTPYYLCNAMCHETRHAEQYIMISIFDAVDENSRNNIFFDQTARMRKEFVDYTSVDEDYYKYHGQECEKDARSYAEERVEVYFNSLHEYLSENTSWEYLKEYERTVDETGNWSIINSDGKVIFTGAEKINDLHEGVAEVTAVVDGRAMILSLSEDTDCQAMVIKDFDGYRDITDILCDSFAIVTDLEGNKGIVDLGGRVIIPADYAQIAYSEQYVTDDGRHGIQFALRQNDMIGDVILLEFNPLYMTPWAVMGE